MSTVTVDPGIHEQGPPWPESDDEWGWSSDPHVVVEVSDSPSARAAVASVIQRWLLVGEDGTEHDEDRLRDAGAPLDAYTPNDATSVQVPGGFLLSADTKGELPRAMLDGLIRVVIDEFGRLGEDVRVRAAPRSEWWGAGESPSALPPGDEVGDRGDLVARMARLMELGAGSMWVVVRSADEGAAMDVMAGWANGDWRVFRTTFDDRGQGPVYSGVQEPTVDAAGAVWVRLEMLTMPFLGPAADSLQALRSALPPGHSLHVRPMGAGPADG